MEKNKPNFVNRLDSNNTFKKNYTNKTLALKKQQIEKKSSDTPSPYGHKRMLLTQDMFLEDVVRNNLTLELTLANGEKINGKLIGYDKFALTFVDSSEGKDTGTKDGSPQIIYKTFIMKIKRVQ